VIKLDEDDVKKIDDEVHNELNTLVVSFMNLDNNSTMKSGKMGDNPSSELAITSLGSFPPPAHYTNQDWKANDLLDG
jgi:hypothetical protein